VDVANFRTGAAIGLRPCRKEDTGVSRAFVKDDDGGTGVEDLPDRLVSGHRNLVTPEGLAHIDAEIDRLQEDYATAQGTGDRSALQRVARDLRYWTARRSTAEVQEAAAPDGIVHFGSKVTILRSDGRKQTYRIVGEDEADPAKGTLSYVSPLAQALLGRRAGEEVKVGASTAEIEEIG
jgi:transcription elongation GreA/GreB family factor